MAKKITLATLAKQMEKGFVAVAADIADMREHMSTKDDVRAIIRAEVPGIVREETTEIREEVASVRADLETLSGKVDNIVGLPKEIDHALERIAAIEKQLGISKKIAA